jgi:recombinational DNA repair protein RecR
MPKEPKYLRALNEYSDTELARELHIRSRRRAVGVCDFCGKARDEDVCRFSDRHRMAKTRKEIKGG